MIGALLRDLRQPEYVHVLLNPLPIYGLAVAWLALLIALFLRNRRAQISALILLFVCSVSAWPVKVYGDAAKDPVISMENEIGQDWIEEHERRADQFLPYFLVLAVVSIVAIAAPAKWPRSSLPLTLAAVLLGAAVLGMGAYIGQAGGKIRHHEFRNEPPPKRGSDGP